MRFMMMKFNDQLTKARALIALAALLMTTSILFAQGTGTPTTPATPATPPSPVTGIHNKISTGDLLSAESMLEVRCAKNGEDTL